MTSTIILNYSLLDTSYNQMILNSKSSSSRDMGSFLIDNLIFTIYNLVRNFHYMTS